MTSFEGSGLGVHVRWMIRRDMPEALNAEQEAFEFPWSEEDFTRCLRQRNCIGMVADIPCPSQVIPAGRPICTLFGHGPTPPAALGQLRRRTGAVATALRDLSPPSAAAQ